ncbi:MAG: MarR family transcriptional regulator [Bryobacteraceae bacterium]|nr:MarR family transcriptional regulator [Bryobacteraceae bacterium]
MTRPTRKADVRHGIGIASPAEMKKRLLAAARGDKVTKPGEPKIWVSSVDALMRVLTPENRELLSVIRREKPASVSDLAQRVGREQGNVSRSIGKLERYGLVQLVPVGRQKRPEVALRRLKLEVDLETGVCEVV